ncbi:hypothetical protein [Parasphingorhabdus flavimaris]|jgi:hypothetical protein|uniref:Uncharacterized protein n=1 Tax=Parasphingorhabdus flavimaris TaxID=266812 RepID=A0ABX2MYJ4_9SPHN|nr:hypothetical protein [Parasphingorhabdus flavimaris]NVD26522.1 hypothetical protein [Parasphingorhabdus flavimaris]|tara:strand:+ start:4401 stop:4712 length:312 start_codon:yes stop_codon:yes gene_type:complete
MKILVQTVAAGALIAIAFVVPTLSAYATKSDNIESKSKAPQKITDRRHPDYVRCRSEPIIGSLARKRRICMTNAEWAEYVKAGSRDSKQFVEDMQVGIDQNAQ